MGPKGVPYCIQKKITDEESINCQGNECGFDKAYLGNCNGKDSLLKEPFCDNREVAHYIEINKDGKEGKEGKEGNITQTIRFLSSKYYPYPEEICLGHSGDNVVYGNCKLYRNKDKKINNKWKVYRKEGDNDFKILSPDGRCLTRVKYNGDEENNKKEEKELNVNGFASLKLENCNKEKKEHQQFQIKSMGDTDNCKSTQTIERKAPIKRGVNILSKGTS